LTGQHASALCVRLLSCRKMTDFRARDVWYPICLKMQNMIVRKPRTVLLWDYVSISFHTLHDIAFKRFETIMIMFQLTWRW